MEYPFYLAPDGDGFKCSLCRKWFIEQDGSWDGPEHTPEGFICYDCLGELEETEDCDEHGYY